MPSPASGGLSPTNDLFILGNGTGPETENRSNALIVKRNGNMEVKGTSLKVDGIEVLKENSTRYVQVREDNTIVGGAMAGTDPWSGGIALGYQAWAGSNALSIGNLAGTSSHSGEYSISVGREAKSLGNSSVAVGRGPLAGSTNSTAIGQFAGTYAEQAIAIGTDVKANQVGQIVLGAYNQQTSPSTLRAPTDALFILGSGTANDSRSNALIVKRNGNMEVKGNSLTVNGAEVLTLASLDAAVENINLTNGNYISRNVTIGMYYGTSATAAPHSIALGEQATASGTQSSSAIGFNARSNQTGTHALGNHLVANRPGQIVLGNYNAYGSSLAGSSTAAPEDPVFIVGNGTSDSVRSNALLIRRNGNIELTGSSLTFNGSAFLTQTTADTRYLTQASASTAYLTQASADTRYLTPTAATALYQPLLPTGTTYLTTADLIPLQTDIDSKIGLVELETEIDDALGDALTNLDLTGNYLSKDPQTGLAYGTGSTAAAPSSASIGTQLVANQPGQVVVGAYNRYSAPPSTPQPQDALFVVGAGNGVAEDPDERKNAFEVRRNGDASVSGVLRVPEAGDLSMGAFTDGLTPFPDAD